MVNNLNMSVTEVSPGKLRVPIWPEILRMLLSW